MYNFFFTFFVFSCDEKCKNSFASWRSVELGISSLVLLICRRGYCIARLPLSVNIFKHRLWSREADSYQFFYIKTSIPVVCENNCNQAENATFRFSHYKSVTILSNHSNKTAWYQEQFCKFSALYLSKFLKSWF